LFFEAEIALIFLLDLLVFPQGLKDKEVVSLLFVGCEV